MTQKNRYQGCSAVLGTLTNAQKAQYALAAAAIPSRVIKETSPHAYRGCVWSVEFSCNQQQNVSRLLASAGISVKGWSGGNDIP